MKTLKLNLFLLCFSVISIASAQKLSKISKSINVDKDVKIDLNTSYVQIEVDTWNKDVIEIEAFIESDKLSKEELKEALENWDIQVEGSGDYVKIFSKGFSGSWDDFSGALIIDGDYGDILRDLELKLADIPEMPLLPALAEMPTIHLGDFPELPEMPEMPEFPELPELPEGVNTIHFDYDKYKKEGEPYLEKWSKEYEEKYGKEYKESMKAWAKKFAESGYQEKMEKWGEEFGKRFEGKWAKDMEEWGEKFGEQFGEDFGKRMEKWGKELEKSFGKDFEKKMEAWGEKFGREMEKYAETLERRMEERDARTEERRDRLEERRQELEERRETRMQELEERLAEREARMEERREALKTRFIEGGERNVKKTIKIKMPKDAKLNLNVRHGELKFSSVIHNLKADLSHSTLLATSIDGNDTSINASYSSILVNDWKYGNLNLNYVEDASLKLVEALMLNSNSSNIDIDVLSGTSIIDGSFGELTIHNIMDSFKNLNIVLENSEALVKLPKTDYNLQYKGNLSRLVHPKNISGKSVKSFTTGNLKSNKTIVVNAKFSDVVMQ